MRGIKACLRRTVDDCLSHDVVACTFGLATDGVSMYIARAKTIAPCVGTNRSFTPLAACRSVTGASLDSILAELKYIPFGVVTVADASVLELPLALGRVQLPAKLCNLFPGRRDA
jgi:hypothetical protein